MIQVCVARLEGYGPWTLGLGPDREHRLQVLQASVYARLQEELSARGCLAFQNRHDEMIAVTNGLDGAGHAEAAARACGGSGVRLSVRAAAGPTPLEAAAAAGRAAGPPSGPAPPGCTSTILHLDVDGMTGASRSMSPYEATSRIFGAYADMCRFFAERGSMAFFMGGDNFMVAAGPGHAEAAAAFAGRAREAHGLSFNCGIGTAPAAREAARLATESLDAVRRDRDADPAAPRIRELPCS